MKWFTAAHSNNLDRITEDASKVCFPLTREVRYLFWIANTNWQEQVNPTKAFHWLHSWENIRNLEINNSFDFILSATLSLSLANWSRWKQRGVHTWKLSLGTLMQYCLKVEKNARFLRKTCSLKGSSPFLRNIMKWLTMEIKRAGNKTCWRK